MKDGKISEQGSSEDALFPSSVWKREEIFLYPGIPTACRIGTVCGGRVNKGCL